MTPRKGRAPAETAQGASNTGGRIGERVKRQGGRTRPVYVAVWLSESGAAAIDERARLSNLLNPDGSPNRSAAIRMMLKFAAERMPR